ncbi:hypothetical protein BDL97_14G032100 [Sphagnum fallax]|nr:hypothetical protein BDL97_14G032100 [Sphagnum fallax]
MVLKNRDPVKKDQNPFYDDPTRASKAHFDRNRFWKHHLVSTMSCKGQREDQAAATNAVAESLHTQQAMQESKGLEPRSSSTGRVGSNRARHRPARPGTYMGI